MTKLLIQFGADIDSKIHSASFKNKTPLELATNKEIIKILLSAIRNQ